MQAVKLNIWQKMKSYLVDEFKIPMGDPLYYMRLTNSMQLAIEVIILSLVLSLFCLKTRKLILSINILFIFISSNAAIEQHFQLQARDHC